METNSDPRASNPVELTADIVSAYVSNNSIPRADLAGLIASVHQSLGRLTKSSAPKVNQIEKVTPARIRKSITPDALFSFIDGKPYKSMRRHLAIHGHTPEAYRAKYGLPADYPIVAPSYSAARSKLAKELGLGQRYRIVGPKAAAAE